MDVLIEVKLNAQSDSQSTQATVMVVAIETQRKIAFSLK